MLICGISFLNAFEPISCVVTYSRVGIQKIALFGKKKVHIMARTAQISKEKRQSIITLRHEGQSIWKMSRTFKVSSSAVTKTIQLYDETVSHEDRHRKIRPRVTSAAPQIAAQINASQSSSNRHISISTVRRSLCESDPHG